MEWLHEDSLTTALNLSIQLTRATVTPSEHNKALWMRLIWVCLKVFHLALAIQVILPSGEGDNGKVLMAMHLSNP